MRQRYAVAERAKTRIGDRVKTPALPFIVICVGILTTPTPLRELLFGEFAKAINVVAWFGLIVAILSTRPPINILRMKFSPVLVALLMAALLALGTVSATQSLPLDLVAYVAPVLIVLYAGDRSLASSARQLLPIWCWFLNFAVAVIVIGGVIDLLSSGAASRFFTELYGVRSYVGLLSEGRMVSFYGHALVSATIVMVAFCSNYLLKLGRQTRLPSYFLIFYVLAMALTTSKTGFVLILAAIVLTSFQRGRWRNLLILLVGLVAAYVYGLLDTVLSRLIEGYESGDITTGRNVALEALFGSGNMSFHLLSGQVIDSSDVALIAALEYPLLRFAFKYGIVFALLFGVAFFVYPLLKFLKRRHIRPLVAWVALAISVNSYSGIAAYGDILLLFSITTMLALMVCRVFESDVGGHG